MAESMNENGIPEEGLSKYIDDIIDRSVVNFSMGITTDAIKQNVSSEMSVGMRPKIIRSTDGNCCAWCSAMAGEYYADEAPKDIYRRHDNCTCTVTYVSEKGAQDAHTKKFITRQELEERRGRISEDHGYISRLAAEQDARKAERIRGDKTLTSKRNEWEDTRVSDELGFDQWLKRDNTIKSEMRKAGVTDMNLEYTRSSATYKMCLQEGKLSNVHGGSVDDQSLDVLDGCKKWLADDGMAGVAVKDDGDIIAVFKNSNSAKRGAVNDLIMTARANGGTKMDCYGQDLVRKYEKCGFKPVARVKFDSEFVTDKELLERKPDVYVMIKTDDSMATVIEKYKNGTFTLSTKEQLDNLPTFDYDKAMEYRDSLL